MPYNIDDYPARGGRVIGEDGQVYNLVDLLQSAGGGGGDMKKEIYDTDDSGVVDAAESVPWSGVSSKPTAFPPESHNHGIADVTGLQAALDEKLTAAQAAAQADSVAEDVPTLVGDFNALLAKLRAAGIIGT